MTLTTKDHLEEHADSPARGTTPDPAKNVSTPRGWSRVTKFVFPDGCQSYPPPGVCIWRDPKGHFYTSVGLPVNTTGGTFRVDVDYLVIVWSDPEKYLDDLAKATKDLNELGLSVSEMSEVLQDDDRPYSYYEAEWRLPLTMTAEQFSRMNEILAHLERELPVEIEVDLGPHAVSRVDFLEMVETKRKAIEEHSSREGSGA